METPSNSNAALSLLADLLPLINRHGEETFHRVVSMRPEELEQLIRENEPLIKKLALERMVREIMTGQEK